MEFSKCLWYGERKKEGRKEGKGNFKGLFSFFLEKVIFFIDSHFSCFTFSCNWNRNGSDVGGPSSSRIQQ